MRSFLNANDPAARAGYTLRTPTPTRIVQGGADPFVLEPIQTPFVARLKARGAPVTFRVYKAADHFTVIRHADADGLLFLRQRFAYGFPATKGPLL